MNSAAEEQIAAAIARAAYADAAEITLRSYGREIYGFLYRATGDDDLAGEAYGQFCEDLWRGLPTFEGRSAMRTWAYRLARNARLRLAQRAHRRREVHDQSAAFVDLAAQIRSRTQVWLRTETKDAITALRDALSPDERELLVLRIDQRMPWDAIAAVLGDGTDPKRAAATLRMRYQRTKQKLKRLAQQAGLLDAE